MYCMLHIGKQTWNSISIEFIIKMKIINIDIIKFMNININILQINIIVILLLAQNFFNELLQDTYTLYSGRYWATFCNLLSAFMFLKTIL